MKLLHLVILFGIGGTEELFYNLIKHYPDPTTEHVIVNCAELSDKKEHDNHHARSLKRLNQTHVRLIQSNLNALENIIAQEKPDVIHSTYPDFLPFAYSAFVSRGIPFVPVWHNPPIMQSWWSRSRDAQTMLSFMRQDAITQYSVSDYATTEFKKVFNYPHFEPIHNGIDRERFTFSQTAREDIRNRYGIPQNGLVIGSVGRIDLSWKRQDWLVDALAYLHTKGYDNVYAMILGEGSGLEELKNITKTHNLEKHIIFAGVQKNPTPYYSAFDVFAHPSKEENCSLVTMEALSCGIPVVMCNPITLQNTDKDGYGIVRHGYNGLVVPPEDKQGYYEALEKIISDADLREQCAAAARTSTEKHDVKKMAQRYHDVFTKTIAQKHAPNRLKAREFNRFIKRSQELKKIVSLGVAIS